MLPVVKDLLLPLGRFGLSVNSDEPSELLLEMRIEPGISNDDLSMELKSSLEWPPSSFCRFDLRGCPSDNARFGSPNLLVLGRFLAALEPTGLVDGVVTPSNSKIEMESLPPVREAFDEGPFGLSFGDLFFVPGDSRFEVS